MNVNSKEDDIRQSATPMYVDKKLNSKNQTLDSEMSADAGIRTRVLTLARSSDNQLHYIRN